MLQHWPVRLGVYLVHCQHIIHRHNVTSVAIGAYVDVGLDHVQIISQRRCAAHNTEAFALVF